MNRFSRFIGCVAASVMFYFASVQAGLSWVSVLTYAKFRIYFTFDSIPLYMILLLPIITFVADTIARETFRGTALLGGFIAAAFNVVMLFPSVLLSLCFNHAFVDDSVLVESAKEFAVSVALFQMFVTVSMHFVDIIFCKTKRFAFLHFLLTVSAAIGSVLLLKIDYEMHIVSQVLLPWIESHLIGMTLADLIPLVVACGVMLLVLIGITAGIAAYPSVVGPLLFVLVDLDITALLLFQPPARASADNKLPSLFVTSPLGRIILGTLAVSGLIVSLLPLFNSSPIAESFSAIVARNSNNEEEKKNKKNKKDDAKTKSNDSNVEIEEVVVKSKKSSKTPRATTPEETTPVKRRSTKKSTK